MRVSSVVRRDVLEILDELSNSEFQERVWVQGHGPEVSSPSEAVSQLFDDTGLTEILEDSSAETPVFSLDVDTLLRQLSRRIDEVDLRREAASIVADPVWKEVQRLSAEASSKIRSLSFGRQQD